MTRRDYISALGVFLATIALFIVASLLVHGFGSIGQIFAIIVTTSFLIVATFGQGLVILIGGIDLSTAAVAGFSGVLLSQLAAGSNAELLWALPLSLGVCIGIGLINGLLIAVWRLPSFVVTLASGIVVSGVGLALMFGQQQQAVPELLSESMNGQWRGVPYVIGFLLVFGLIAFLVQDKSVYGRLAHAIGNSRRAAIVAGVPVSNVVVATFGISALCAGLAGAMLAGYSSSATLDDGGPLLLGSIAAAVIGGTRAVGGVGSALGNISGALLLGCAEAITTTLNMPQGIRYVISGLIILVALAVHNDRIQQTFSAMCRRMPAATHSKQEESVNEPQRRSRELPPRQRMVP